MLEPGGPFELRWMPTRQSHGTSMALEGAEPRDDFARPAQGLILQEQAHTKIASRKIFWALERLCAALQLLAIGRLSQDFIPRGGISRKGAGTINQLTALKG